MATHISEKQKLVRKLLNVERILTRDLIYETVEILERSNKTQSSIEARRHLLTFLLQHFHESEDGWYIKRLEKIAEEQNEILVAGFNNSALECSYTSFDE